MLSVFAQRDPQLGEDWGICVHYEEGRGKVRNGGKGGVSGELRGEQRPYTIETMHSYTLPM